MVGGKPHTSREQCGHFIEWERRDTNSWADAAAKYTLQNGDWNKTWTSRPPFQKTRLWATCDGAFRDASQQSFGGSLSWIGPLGEVVPFWVGGLQTQG